MALVSVGVRLAPEVPLWCDCAEVALEPRGCGGGGVEGGNGGVGGGAASDPEREDV